MITHEVTMQYGRAKITGDLKERVLQQKELDYGPKVRSYFDNVVL